MAEKNKKPTPPQSSSRLGSLSRLSERFSKATLAASHAASESAAELRVASAKARTSAAASLSAAKVRGAELAKKFEDNTTKATARRALENVLRDWIELDADNDSLRVSLRKGEVVLRDVKLKPRPLVECFGIASGSIKEAVITMPWTGEAAKIVVSDVRVEVVGDLEAVDAGFSSRAEIVDLLSSGGNNRFFSARRMFVKALATLEIECTHLRVDYSNCVVAVGSLSATAGEDYSAELQDLKLDNFLECPRLKVSVTDTLCELSSEVVSVRTSGCDSPIAAVAEFRAAQRRSEIGGGRKRPTHPREWWQLAMRACLVDKRRPLVAWWKAVDLALLRREYDALRKSQEPADKQRLDEIEATTPIRTILAFRAEDEDLAAIPAEAESNNIFSVAVENVNLVDDDTVVSGFSFVKRDSHVLARARGAVGTLTGEEDFAIATFSDDVLRLEAKGATCSLADAARLKTAYDYCKEITCFSKLSTIQPKAIALSVEATNLALQTPSTRVELAKFDMDVAEGLSLKRDDVFVEIPTAKVDVSRLLVPTIFLDVAEVFDKRFVATNVLLDAVGRSAVVEELASSSRQSLNATHLVISETKLHCDTVRLDYEELLKVIQLYTNLRQNATATTTGLTSTTTSSYQICANDAVLSFGPSLLASASRLNYDTGPGKLTADTARLLVREEGGEPLLTARSLGVTIADTYVVDSGASVRLRPRALLELLQRNRGDSQEESSFAFSAQCPSTLEVCLVEEKEEIMTDVDLNHTEKSDDVFITLDGVSVDVDASSEVQVGFELGRLETPGLNLTKLSIAVGVNAVKVGIDGAAIDVGKVSRVAAATAYAFRDLSPSSSAASSDSLVSSAKTTNIAVNRVDVLAESISIYGAGISAVVSPHSQLSLEFSVERLEAAVEDVQVVEPATLRIARRAKTVEAQVDTAVKSGTSLLVYVSPQDIGEISRACASAHEALSPLFAIFKSEDSEGDEVAAWSVAVLGTATLSIINGSFPRACPAISFDFSEPILDARRNSVTLTSGLVGFKTFDAELERWKPCLMLKSGKSISVCAQSIDTDLRICVGGEMLDLYLESSMAASIARIATAVHETSERHNGVFPDIEMRNGYGKALEVDGTTLRHGKSRVRPPPPVDSTRDAIGEARDGSPAQPILVHDGDTNTLFEVPLPRYALTAPVDETTSLLITAEEQAQFLVAEYTKRDGAIVVAFRSAARLVNRCRCALECELVESDKVLFRGTVEKSMELPTTRDATVRVRRLDDDGTSDWVECGTIRDVLKMAVAEHRRRMNRETRSVYRRGAAKHTASVRWFAAAQDSAGAIVVCPARTLTNRLPRRVRIATARAWPRSRDDYAAVYNLGPFESCDLRLVDARYWCARLDGYDAQSEWVDTATVSATDLMPAGANNLRFEAARFVVSTAGTDGNDDDFEYGVWTSDSLALELVRAPPSTVGDSSEEQAAGVVNLEFCCQLLCVDNNTGLGLDFLGRSEAFSSLGGKSAEDSSMSPRHKMLDVSPHSALVLEATARRSEPSKFTPGAIAAAPRSAPFVPSAALASRPAKGERRDAVVSLVPPQRGDGGLLEVSFRERFCGQQRVIDFCPRISITHRASCGDLDLVARQAVTREELSVICARAKSAGPAAPFYWTRCSAPFALQLAWMPSDGRGQATRWTPAIHPRVFEESDGDDVVLVELPAPTFSKKTIVLRLKKGSGGAASFELVAADMDPKETYPIKRQQPPPQISPQIPLFRSVRVELEAVGVRLAELELACPRGATMAWSTKKDDTRLASFELKKPLVVRDNAARTPDAFSSRGDPSLPAFKTTVRLREQLAGAIEVGDAALCLSEAAVWRVLECVRRAATTCEYEARGKNASRAETIQNLLDVEVVRVSALCLSPATLVADVSARKELKRSLAAADQGGSGGPWTTKVSLGLLTAFPKLGLENAEVNFDACEVRPRPSALPAGDLANMILDAYASQLKQRWWTLASSISLSGASSFGVGGGISPPTPQPPPPRQKPSRTTTLRGGSEYEIVVGSEGSLGLVIHWRDADGVPVVTERKAPGSRGVAEELELVGVGDVVVSVNGRPGGSHTTDELVQIMRRRPLTLIMKKSSDFVELVVPKSEPSLGFSVGRDPTKGLVVTQVRAGSILDKHRVGAGARLLKVNEIDVSKLPLESLTEICRNLADTDRVLLLLHADNDDSGVEHKEENLTTTTTNPFAAEAAAKPTLSPSEAVSIFD